MNLHLITEKARARYAVARALVDAGFSYSEAAKELGWTRSAVAGVIARHRQDEPTAAQVNHAVKVGDMPSLLAAARREGLSESGYRYRRAQHENQR